MSRLVNTGTTRFAAATWGRNLTIYRHLVVRLSITGWLRGDI